ncbi:MAG TPA: ATP synthase F1 subunit delta [Phycisphaerales bacterium]|jgi:F-type H+-transporting ATPase subunit delta|nr:ATP synthase F1 subunit delta [Phycisphaerales bacterium]
MPLTHSEPDALARIYATSLFSLAKSEGGPQRSEEVQGELEDILELARSNAQFGEFLASLILSAKERKASLERILKGRVSDLTYKFLQVLNEKGRLGHLSPIVAAYEQMVQHAYGRVEVDVYTAAPIDQQEVAAIRDRLKSMLGKEPVIHPYIDEGMIGGLRLQIGDQLIDGSVRTQLRKLRDNLSATGGAEIRSKAAGMIEGN